MTDLRLQVRTTPDHNRPTENASHETGYEWRIVNGDNQTVETSEDLYDTKEAATRFGLISLYALEPYHQTWETIPTEDDPCPSNNGIEQCMHNARADTCTSTRHDPTYGDYRCQKEPGHTREHQAPSATAAGNICGVVTWWDPN